MPGRCGAMGAECALSDESGVFECRCAGGGPCAPDDGSVGGNDHDDDDDVGDNDRSERICPLAAGFVGVYVHVLFLGTFPHLKVRKKYNNSLRFKKNYLWTVIKVIINF